MKVSQRPGHPPPPNSGTAGHSGDRSAIAFTITHPFHPKRGCQLVLATRRQNWGEDRVMFFDDQGRLRSMLTTWTSLAGEDAFAQASGTLRQVRVGATP